MKDFGGMICSVPVIVIFSKGPAQYRRDVKEVFPPYQGVIMMLNIPFKTLAVLAVLAAPLLGSAQVYRYSGAGTTTRSGVLVSPYTPPPGTTPNPMNSWTYRAAEKTLPYVGATRNCAFGALAGGGFGALRGGNPYMGMATGCIGAVKPAFSMRPANAW